MKLIICMRLGMYVFHSVDSYGCSQTRLDMPKVIQSIESAICQD